jgi:hypothetical protein
MAPATIKIIPSVVKMEMPASMADYQEYESENDHVGRAFSRWCESRVGRAPDRFSQTLSTHKL